LILPEAKDFCEWIVVKKVWRPEGVDKERGDEHHDGGADEPPLDRVRMVPVVLCPPYLDTWKITYKIYVGTARGR